MSALSVGMIRLTSDSCFISADETECDTTETNLKIFLGKLSAP